MKPLQFIFSLAEASHGGLAVRTIAHRGKTMGLIVVNISEMAISNRKSDVLITYSLGSCLGVSVYDPQIALGGLIHCLLPLASASPDKAKANPHMFVNTGVSDMIRTLMRMGASRTRLIIKVAGGGKMMGVNNIFDVGARNFSTAQKLFSTNNLTIAGKEVGGSIPRTLSLFMETGKVTIRSLGAEKEL